jgi:hypothetical protein
VQARRSSRSFPPSCRPTPYVVWISHLDIATDDTSGGSISIPARVRVASQSDARRPSNASGPAAGEPRRAITVFSLTGADAGLAGPLRLISEPGVDRRDAPRCRACRMTHTVAATGADNGGVHIDRVSGNGEITG